jgi:hypothetical protein
MFLVGFEPMTPVFERAKTVHALDFEATVIGSYGLSHVNMLLILTWRNWNDAIAQMQEHKLFLRHMFSNSSLLQSNSYPYFRNGVQR